MFKCLPQGLSVSGPYFQAWLTRLFRKYNVVMNQTIYVPKDKEGQRIKTVDNMIAAAKHIQTASPRYMDSIENSMQNLPSVRESAALQHDMLVSHRHFYLDRYTMLHLGMHLNPNIRTVLFTPIHSPDPGGGSNVTLCGTRNY